MISSPPWHLAAPSSHPCNGGIKRTSRGAIMMMIQRHELKWTEVPHAWIYDQNVSLYQTDFFIDISQSDTSSVPNNHQLCLLVRDTPYKIRLHTHIRWNYYKYTVTTLSPYFFSSLDKTFKLTRNRNLDLSGLSGHFQTSLFVLNSQARSFHFRASITWRFLIIKHQV